MDRYPDPGYRLNEQGSRTRVCEQWAVVLNRGKGWTGILNQGIGLLDRNPEPGHRINGHWTGDPEPGYKIRRRVAKPRYTCRRLGTLNGQIFCTADA